jgi:hypothetical protein
MNENTQNPPPETETRPRPEGETRPRPQSDVIERRSMAHTLAESYLDGTMKAAGVATVAGAVHVVAKVTDALTSKEEPSKVVLPPGVNPED